MMTHGYIHPGWVNGFQEVEWRNDLLANCHNMDTLGVHDPSRGTVSDVGSGQTTRSGPLVVAKGLELNGNGLWYRY